MHQPIVDGLEDYLSAKESSPLLGSFRAHLAVCEPCRVEVAHVEAQSLLMRTLRAPESMNPAPGFYARVMERIEAQTTSSFWSVLLEPAFGRRLLFASLALLIVLSAAVVNNAGNPELHEVLPADVMASAPPPDLSGADPQRDREMVFVNLATYNGAVTELPTSSD